jgi:3-hydroxyisobutyryl-CoA hydrolase
MPEANFGYLPDAGCSFYLSRLDGQLGVYLGLTGKSLKGMDLVYAGLASHYIPSAALPDMENGLRKMISPSHAVINQLLDTCSSTHMSGEDVPEFSLGGEIRQAIDR